MPAVRMPEAFEMASRIVALIVTRTGRPVVADSSSTVPVEPSKLSTWPSYG